MHSFLTVIFLTGSTERPPLSLDKYTAIGVMDGHAMGKDRLCTFTIRSNKYKGRNRTGEIFSPTYPGTPQQVFHSSSQAWQFLMDHQDLSYPFHSGTYPKNIKCGYKFIGEPGQRIRLEFRDFDLFYGGAQ